MVATKDVSPHFNSIQSRWDCKVPLSFNLSLQRKVKRANHTNQRKSKTRRGKETSFLVDDDEIGEIIEDDEEDEDDIDDADDEDDAYSGDVSFNMTGKEDPDFSPGIDSIKKAAASQPVRRSSR